LIEFLGIRSESLAPVPIVPGQRKNGMVLAIMEPVTRLVLNSGFTGFRFFGAVRIQFAGFLLGFAVLACDRTLNTVWPGSCVR
jgi:hypothetical protein